MATRPPKKSAATYATFEHIKVLVPQIEGFIRTIPSTTEQENYVTECLKLAVDWMDNQIEAQELSTFAKSNEKKLIVANYAAYLILRGLVRGERAEQNNWVKSYKEDAEKLLQDLKDKRAVAPGHSSSVESFTKKRYMLKKFVKETTQD